MPVESLEGSIDYRPSNAGDLAVVQETTPTAQLDQCAVQVDRVRRFAAPRLLALTTDADALHVGAEERALAAHAPAPANEAYDATVQRINDRLAARVVIARPSLRLDKLAHVRTPEAAAIHGVSLCDVSVLARLPGVEVRHARAQRV